MKCDKCGSSMRKMDRREEMAELDEGATDGQIADYLMAELSGDGGAWNVGVVEYHCRKCDRRVEVQSGALPNYMDLVVRWHKKAAEEDDYFARFVFEYLAFIAHLKSNVFYEGGSDRSVIQSLKRDHERQERYAKQLKHDRQLLKALEQLLKELKQRPLHNSSQDTDYPEIDKWWNCSGPNPNENQTLPRGIIRSADDWENLVEFWYGVRNNLFHGGKDPSVRRDLFLVEHAYRTLKVFMGGEVPSVSSEGSALTARKRKRNPVVRKAGAHRRK